jgi:hypothetical protein
MSLSEPKIILNVFFKKLWNYATAGQFSFVFFQVAYCYRQHTLTVRHVRDVRMPASYSRGSWFKSWPGNRLPWLRMFAIVLSSWRQIAGWSLKLVTTDPFQTLSKSAFTSHPTIQSSVSCCKTHNINWEHGIYVTFKVGLAIRTFFVGLWNVVCY